MAILSCRKKRSTLYAAFGADTSIRYASRIKSALLKISSEPVNAYHLDLSGVRDTDITFIQLLIAFNEMLKKQNRRMFIIDPPAGSQFLITASECGIDYRSLFEIKDG